MLTQLTEYLYMGHTVVKFGPHLLNDIQKLNKFLLLLEHLYNQALEEQKLSL